MLRTRTECLSLTLEAEEENMSSNFRFNFYITCNQERDEKEKVGDRLQEDHPQGLLQNGVKVLPVIIGGPIPIGRG